MVPERVFSIHKSLINSEAHCSNPWNIGENHPISSFLAIYQCRIPYHRITPYSHPARLAIVWATPTETFRWQGRVMMPLMRRCR